MLADKLRQASSGRRLPYFISSSVSRSGAGTNTVSAPSGIQDGDLLIAIGFSATPGLGIAVPVGFNTCYFDDSTSNATFVATKTASSESGGYTFTWTSDNNNIVAVMVYRAATRINVVGSITKTATNLVTASGVTPTYSGVLCAYFANSDDNVTVSGAPSDMTNRVSYVGSTGVRPGAFLVYDRSLGAVGSGSKSVTLTGNANSSVAMLFQVTNEPLVAPEFVAYSDTQNTVEGPTLTITKPAGVISGDLLVAVMSIGGTGVGTWTGDAGWSETADLRAMPSLRLAYKVAGGSEPSSYTFTCTEPGDFTAGAVLAYRYASYDTTGAFTTDTEPLKLPTITPSLSQSVILAFVSQNVASASFSTPYGMSTKVLNSDGVKPSYVVYDQVVQKGSIGSRNVSGASSSGIAGILMSIKPTRSLS